MLLFTALCAATSLQAQTYQRVVCDSLTREPLQYAIASLCTSTGEVVSSGMTTSAGVFKLQGSKEAGVLQVSFAGYSTWKRPVAALPDTVFLAPVLLKEVEITASREVHDIDKDTYQVTDSLRKGTSFAADMLGLLPGINYNWYDGALSVYGQKNILLLVNGLEKPSGYIKNINPKRITKVEVVHNPGGRYISDHYAAIINLILYEDYVGWDLILSNKSLVNLGKLDQADWLMDENPDANFSYTRNKLTVNASYHYDRKNMSVFQSFMENYPGIIENETATSGDQDPNTKVLRRENYFSAGADYQLSKNHTLSFQGKYSYDSQEINGDNSIWSQASGQAAEYEKRESQDYRASNDWVGSLFYRGTLGERWSLYSDFNYNYYDNNSTSSFVQDDWFSTNNQYKGEKNYTRFSVDATYAFPSHATLKAGYSTTWRRYISDNMQTGLRESKTDSYRNRLFSYFSYKFNKVWSISFGGAGEWVRDKNEERNEAHFSFMPDARVMYKPGKLVDIVLQYYSNMGYPSFDQTAIGAYRVDSLMTFTGNPYLTEAVSHNASLRVRLWNTLTISPSVTYNGDYITSYYAPREDGSVLSYSVNSDYRSYSLGVNYEKFFWKYFMISTYMCFRREEIRYEGIKNSSNMWAGNVNLMYMDRKTGWRVMAEYRQRTAMGSSVRIQGESKGGDNYWMAAVMKSFCKDRMSVMVAYFPPIKWLINEKEQRGITTPYYQYDSKTYTYDLFKNLAMVRINYRLDYGKRTKKQENKTTVDAEAIDTSRKGK